MLQSGGYIFKRAETPEELEQIHALNYRTFVDEIPQHRDEDDGSGRLVDKFHQKNQYLVAIKDGKVVGMLSTHGEPPFSVTPRLPDPSALDKLPRPMEVRLLAIEKEYRNRFVVGGLLWATYLHSESQGASHLIISGVEQALPLYEQLGFEPMGPAVQSGDASFVPMAVSLEKIGKTKKRFIELILRKLNREEARNNHSTAPAFVRPEKEICLLPGPVAIPEHVHRAFQRPPIYHRGKEFVALYERVRSALASLVHAKGVALFNGSGTLANEVIGMTLAAVPDTRGLLLVNGEFGERVEKQAKRFSLKFRTLSWEWGKPWDLNDIEKVVSDLPPNSWVWGVHQESSTGVLNDIASLTQIVRAHGHRLCLDCISSLGATPIDLRDVYLASGTSGKSLGAYAGTAIVFANLDQGPQLDASTIPSYLDLPTTLATEGPRFTFPSSTLCALDAALELWSTPEKAQARYQQYRELGQFIRQQLQRVGIDSLGEEASASPVVTTFAPPRGEKSFDFVQKCRSWGFAIGGQSGYLAQRRLVQIATMGDLQTTQIAPFFTALRDHLQGSE